jgi:hypothetical protein
VITETVANILTMARRHADAESPSPTVDFTPDSELTAYFNAAYRKFIDLVLATPSDAAISLLVTKVTLTSPYTMPADFYKVVAVDMQINGTQWTTVRRFSFHNRNAYDDVNYPRYRIEGGQIVLVPPTATPTLQLWYVASGATLTTASTITTFNGWDDFLAWEVARYIIDKEERDPGVALNHIQEARQRIIEACANLAEAGTDRIAVVEYQAEYFFDDEIWWR